MKLYEQVVGRWKAQGLSRKPAVSIGALDAFEAQYGMKLPAALRRLLLLSNGMGDGEYDQTSQIRFWSLEELGRVKNCAPELASSKYHDHLVFADYSVWTHAYAVSLASGEVVIVGAEQPIYVTGSLEDFLTLYLMDEPALFPKSGATVA